MKKRGKLTKEERIELSILREKEYSLRSIAKAMNRSPSTISRELTRNKQKKTGGYNPRKAHHKAYVKKKYSRFEWKKINENKELREFIILCLKKHWNPDEIAGYMKANKIPFYASKTAIYDWLYSSRGVRYCKYLYSKRYTKQRRRKKTKRVMIPSRIGIEKRMKSVNTRSHYGHLEADTIVSGKRGRGALLVTVGRKSRYVSIGKLSSLKPKETAEVLRSIMQNQLVKSITFDNGIENRDHERLGIPTFFCNPYSSWQKGSVENANKMIRRYIPKGTDISQVSLSFIKKVEDVINKKPRRVLGYRSAYDVMLQRGLLD
jgi:IS30 family transposase